MNCARCKDKPCYEGKDCTGRTEEAIGWYGAPADREIYALAARQEAEGYGRLCRVEELIQFGKAMGIRRMGLAFCVGLAREAELLDELLGSCFELTSVCCKVCAVPKEALGLKKIREERFEVACNPIGQATIMNEAATELNVAVGLCLGHDLLFARHSAAPVTTLIVKDRVLGHNPAAALYSSYYAKRLRSQAAGPAQGSR